MAGKLSNIRIKELPEIDLDLDLFGQVGVGLTQLPDINVGLTELPDINIGVTELPAFNLNLEVRELPTLDLRSDSTVRSSSTLQSTSELDVALDLRVTELPRIDFQFGLRPMRIHFPLNYHFCISLFGFRVLEFRTCGEAMVVTEDYQPLESEDCR